MAVSGRIFYKLLYRGAVSSDIPRDILWGRGEDDLIESGQAGSTVLFDLGSQIVRGGLLLYGQVKIYGIVLFR